MVCLRVVAGAKDRAADADPVGALGDGGFEVITHAHRQRIQWQAQAVAEFTQARKSAVLRGSIAGWLGDRHQAAQTDMGQLADCLRQGRQLIRVAARFAGFPADIHLQADVQRRQILRPLG